MVVYTVSYTFQNIGSGFNATNFSTGTSYINSIKTNKITLSGSDLQDQLTTLSTQISNVKGCLTGIVAVPSISPNNVVDIGVTIANFPYAVSTVSPIIQCTLNNKTNVVYASNCAVRGISSVSGSQGSNYNFNIRVKNDYPTTTIPANSCYVAYCVFPN